MKIILALSLFAATLAVALSGCGATDAAPPADIAKHLSYFRDPKTGLCFAVIGSFTYSGYTVTSIAAVPCAALGFREQKGELCQ